MRYFTSSSTSPLEYISCGNLLSRQEFLHPKRCIDSCVLIYVKEGCLYLSQDGRNYEVTPNQYILLNAYEEHFGYKPSYGTLSYLWAHFKFPEEISVLHDISKIAKASSDSPITYKNTNYILPEYGEIIFTKKVPLLFNQLLDLSRNEFLYSPQITNFALSLLVMQISQEVLDGLNKSTNLPPLVNQIMEWIRANYYKPLTVATISKEFGYNADYLSSLFKKSTQNSLVHYIHKTRMDAAKALMINYDISIKEAAYSCGYSDEKYFMKVFKKFENITPSEYKKAFTKKLIN